MKTYTKYIYLACSCWIYILSTSCTTDDAASYEELPEESPYVLRQPEGFPEIAYTVANNPITKKGFELGKKLFFDPRLSADGSISCNNCHQQGRAFSDTPLHPLSIGIDNQTGIRNAPPLTNLAFRKEFFWDGGVTHLDFVAINALESDIEMGETLKNVVTKLNGNEEYRGLFKGAFATDSITAPRMLQAFSQFMLLMISDNAKYDQYQQGVPGVTFSESEARGQALFEKQCSSCHAGPLFTDQSFRNNGLSATFSDVGRASITESESDTGKFIVPSLRNIAVTSPYMHNARFETLEQVVQHYAAGVQDSETLDPLLKQENGSLGISLSSEEQTDLVAFLNTLTDESFLKNTLFNNQ